MLKGGIFIFIVLFFVSTLFSQKKYPNMGVGLTVSTAFIYPFPQLHFTWLPSTKQMVTLRAGVLTDISEIYYPWTTLSYNRLIKYNPKKRTHLFYGATMDFSVGRFLYADYSYGSAPLRFYKRFLVSLAPHFGARVKSGRRNFFSASLALGPASLFQKINEPTANATYRPRVFLLPSLKIEYTFMFKRK